MHVQNSPADDHRAGDRGADPPLRVSARSSSSSASSSSCSAKGAGFLFGGLDLGEFFTSTEWHPTSQSIARYGILALIAGTGQRHGAGDGRSPCRSAWAPPSSSPSSAARGCKETLKIVIELLAAIPSVVWGFIGLTVMNPLIIELTGAPIGVNVLNGGIILALMSVPIIVSIGEDALKAVPDSYREAALALGATRWQIVYRVLLPAAQERPAGGRAAGRRPRHRRDDGRADGHRPRGADPAQPARSGPHADGHDRRRAGRGRRRARDHYQVLFVIGILLFSITFVVNLTADLVVQGVRDAMTRGDRPSTAFRPRR